MTDIEAVQTLFLDLALAIACHRMADVNIRFLKTVRLTTHAHGMRPAYFG